MVMQMKLLYHLKGAQLSLTRKSFGQRNLINRTNIIKVHLH